MAVGRRRRRRRRLERVGAQTLELAGHVGVLAAQPLQRAARLVFATFGEEPGRRFGHEDHGGDEEDGRAGQDPGQHVPRHEGADDVRHDDAQRQEDGREGAEGAAHPRRRTLADLRQESPRHQLLLLLWLLLLLLLSGADMLSRADERLLTKIWADGAVMPIMVPQRMRPT